MITACFCVIVVSQLVLGVYFVFLAATKESESWTESWLQLVLISMLQRKMARSWVIPFSRDKGLWSSRFPPYHYYMVRTLRYLSSGEGHPHWFSYRPSGLLAHHSPGIPVGHVPIQDAKPVQDHSPRCDVLFPGHIHFAPYSRAGFDIWECENNFLFSCR